MTVSVLTNIYLYDDAEPTVRVDTLECNQKRYAVLSLSLDVNVFINDSSVARTIANQLLSAAEEMEAGND